MQNRQQHQNYPSWDRPRDESGRFESQSDWNAEHGNRGTRSQGYLNDQRYPDRDWRPDQNYSGNYGDRGHDGRYTQPRNDYGNRGWRDNDREAGRRDTGQRGDSGWRTETGDWASTYSDRDRFYGDGFEDQNGGNMYRTDSITAIRGNWGSGGRDAGERGWDGSTQSGRNANRGQFAGRGPKGYQRSDERIQEDISEALSQDGDLDASEIEVAVSNGEVTLTGTVSDRSGKRRAEDIVERCSGVQDVHNQIRVQRESRESGASNENREAGTRATSSSAKSHAGVKAA